MTPGTFSPPLTQALALALLDTSVDGGADVNIDVRGRDVRATVVKPPFVQVQAS